MQMIFLMIQYLKYFSFRYLCSSVWPLPMNCITYTRNIYLYKGGYTPPLLWVMGLMVLWY